MTPPLATDVLSFADLIKTVRAERDLTQTDVARLLGVTQATVANWESGKHDMKLPQAVEFAEQLSVPVEWLIEAVKREKASTPKGGGQSCALTGSNRGPAD
ncbi:helix-turn-helix transcriptional regulator [Leucobacter sp. GX0328]